MSVDKFGRHEDFLYRRNVKGPPGEGFSLTAKGHYSMDNKLIRNMGEPKAGKDAVTLHYLQRNCLMKGQSSIIECENRTLRNIHPPTLENDAVSLAYMRTEALMRTSDGNFDGKNKLLRNLKSPIEDTDAATRSFVESITRSILKEVDEKISRLENIIFKFVHTTKHDKYSSTFPSPSTSPMPPARSEVV